MKIKNLLIALVVLALPVTAWADNVAKIGEAEYETLQAAVDAANAGDVIELLQNIDLTTVTTSPSDKYNVNVDKSITIDGKGYTVSSSAGKRAIVLTGEGNDITLKNLKVVNNGSEACLWIANNLTCTLDAVTLDGTNGKSYNQPLTIGSISAEGRVTLNVTNGSVIKTNDAGTAHYAIIAWHPADITVANSSLIGWANVYLKSGADGSIVNISNSTLKSQGISGATNNFSMFTTECGNNTITLTDNNITLNPAADTYMTLITLGGSDNTVQVKGEETTFTTSDLARGGISHQKGDFENNTVTFDEATHSTFAAAINALKEEGVTDTEAGGTYTLGYVCDVYYYWITNGVENGGNYDFDEPFVNNWLADGEFIRLRKDVTLTKNIACLLTSGSFTLTQGEYAVTKGKYSVALKQGVSVNTDKQTDIFTAENADCKVVETATDGGYTYTVIEKTYVAQVGEDKYETLEEAFAAVQGVETITLLSDVTLADEMVLALEGKAITLNLNGKTLNGRTNLTSGNLTIRNGNVELAGGQPLNVYGSATAGTENYSVLTIAEDTKVSGKYGVCMFGPAASSKAGYGAVINVAGEVSGTDGTIFVSGNLGNNIEGDMNNVVNITGKVIGNDNAGVALNGNATVNVKNGAEITGNTAIAIKRGTLNVEDGATVHATGEKNLEPEANNNGTEMTGAAISMTDTYNKYGAMSVNITGGSIKSDNAPALFKKEGTYTNEATFAVSGGTFSSEVPEEFCSDGFIPTEISEGVYGVKEGSFIAQIGTTKYETLESAFATAEDGQTITLLSDVTLADEMVLALEGKAITLNLNGKTLNGRTNLTSGNLTIRNGNVELAGGQPLNVYGSATAGTENYSVLTIAEDTKVSGKYGVCMFGPAASSKAGYGAVINVAGEVSGTDGTIFVSGNLGNNIEGDMNNVVNITGKVIGNDNAGVALNGNATVNVKNGAEITGNTAIAIKRGTLNVEDGATVHATGEKNLEPEANNNGTEMTGAAISMTDTYNKYGAMSVNITGGSIMSDNAPALFKKKGSYSNEATFTVSGGTFSSEVPEEFCAEGYIPADLGNGTYGVKEGSYVAQVDDAKYETLAEAVEAAQGTSVVTLLADVAETYTMSENETLKIKKNGFKFEVAAPEGDFKVETEEADGVTTYTVVALSMEEKDIVLVDGEPYTVTADTQVKSATYTRNYAADRVGKFQAWSMPFDFTITEEAAEKFTFYRINMIAHSANPNDEVQNTDQVWIYVAPMKAGEKLTANRPYAYKPKTEGEFTFTADNNKLYAPDYTSRLHTETVDHSYDFYGTYDTVSIANQGGDFYYMSGSGKISHATQENTTVGSYRWIVKATNKSGANYAPRFEFVEEGAETEGIRSISAGDDVEGYYTLGGTRVETPHHGMFVVKYKNGNIKKQFIK